MTLDEWNALKAGDVVIDRYFAHRGDEARRTILKISRVKAKNSALTRVGLTVSSFKSSSGQTILFETENTGPFRFDMAGAR